jgi:hypothetical protein
MWDARFGLLALVTLQLFFFLGSFYPLTTDFAAWYAGGAVFSFVLGDAAERAAVVEGRRRIGILKPGSTGQAGHSCVRCSFREVGHPKGMPGGGQIGVRDCAIRVGGAAIGNTRPLSRAPR